MLLKIYSPSGKLVTATRDFSYLGAAMGEKTISSALLSAQKLNLPPNSYTEFRGERYLVRNEPSIKRTSANGTRGDAFQTSIVFTSKQYELVDCDFMDYVLNDDMYYTGMDSFSFYGDVYDLCRRIQANLDGQYSGAERWVILMPCKGHDDPQPIINIGWSDRVLESETLQISPSNENCWNALARSNSDFGFFFYLDTAKKLIYVGVEYPEFRVENELITFEYEKGNGLYEIQRDVEANTVITKLRVKGSDRNIDRNYLRNETFPRFTQSLQLPVFRETRYQARPTDYLLADQKLVDYFGVRPGSKTFEDIYPSITGMKDGNDNAIDEIHAIEQLNDTIEANGNLVQSYFYVYLYNLGFDINKFLTSEDATMSMKTGYCAGIDFKIVEASPLSATEPYYSEGCRWKFRLEKDVTSSNNYVIPSGNVKPKKGDQFVLLYILMPESYVTQAEKRLEEAAQKYLDENSRSKISYTINLDEIYLANRPIVARALKEAISMRIVDNELGDMKADNGSSYTVKSVQSLVITYKAEQQIPSYQITLAEKIISNPIYRIENEIGNIAENVQNNDSQNKVNRRNGIRNSRNLRALRDKIFDTDGYFDSENIRPNSVETQYLAVGAKSRDFTTNKISMKAFKEGNVFKVSLSAGYINHRSLWWGGSETPPPPDTETEKYTWGLNEAVVQYLLDNDKDYYVYVKAEHDSQLAEWFVSTDKLPYDFNIDYYYLLLGVIYPVQENRRDISLVNGMAYISGGAIYGDVIKSINYVDDDSNEGSMYGLNDGTIRIGNHTDGGLDYGISTPKTLTVDKALLVEATVKNKLNVEGEADIAGFKFSNEIIKSTATVNSDPSMKLDGKSGFIELISKSSGSGEWEEGGSESGGSSTNKRTTITISSSDGTVTTRNSDGVSMLGANGVFANHAGQGALPASSGIQAYGSVVGLGFGNLAKELWNNQNFIAGVIGRASNSNANPAPAYGGWFQDLMINGMVLNMIDLSGDGGQTTRLLRGTTYVLGNSKGVQHIYLPTDAYKGTTIWFKQWWTGYMRIYAPLDQRLFDDSSENEYLDVGEGWTAMCTYIGEWGSSESGYKGTWMFSKFKF